MLSLASLVACAAPNAPQEFDFSELNSWQDSIFGTVESMRVVRIERDIHAYEETLELRIQPELRDELVIRLDDGRAITIVLNGTQQFQAGERVRVLSHTYSPYEVRVFHE
jgi:outer membrane lipoprotein SlyB